MAFKVKAHWHICFISLKIWSAQKLTNRFQNMTLDELYYATVTILYSLIRKVLLLQPKIFMELCGSLGSCVPTIHNIGTSIKCCNDDQSLTYNDLIQGLVRMLYSIRLWVTWWSKIVFNQYDKFLVTKSGNKQLNCSVYCNIKILSLHLC